MFGLTSEVLANLVRDAAQGCGSGDGFSGHSGRIGVAKGMVAAEAPTAVFQHQGRWRHGDMIALHPGLGSQRDPQVAELTYTTPARCKHPVRHELGACRKFPLMDQQE